MPRLSKWLEKWEDRAESKWGGWYARNRKWVPLYGSLMLLRPDGTASEPHP